MTTIQTQYLRVYSKQTSNKDKPQDKDPKNGRAREHSKEVQEIQSILKPWGGKTLFLDTETTTGANQVLRFGFYEIHGLSKNEMFAKYRDENLHPEDADILREAGVFYDENNIAPEEKNLLQEYVNSTSLQMIADLEGVNCVPSSNTQVIQLMPVEGFVKHFYKLQTQSEMLVIGHNLPFDLSVLATEWTEAGKDYANGFSLKLCTCVYPRKDRGGKKNSCPAHPNIRVKHVGFGKTFIKRSRSNRNTRLRDIHFLDTMALSASLLGTAHSLDVLSKVLLFNTPELQKKDRPEGILSGEGLMLDDIVYGVHDVHTTFACFRELKKHYLAHEINTPIWNMYSSASVGKAHMKEFGFKPFLEQNPDFPGEVLGYSMLAYYGARSEIGVRLQPVEVIYLDFLSQYPSVNALMKNQDILLAQSVTTQDVTQNMKSLLDKDASELLGLLHEQSFWPELRCFVRVKPDHDRLPLRSDYGPESHNVGLPYVTSSTPVWYTLADVIGSKLLTDKTPEVVEAIKLVPSEEKYETVQRRLFGYDIDLNKQDFFKTLIELRQEIKKQSGELAENQQLALKLISNATAYGALVEVTQEESTQEAQDTFYYDLEGHAKHTRVQRIETPGRFFAGPVGSLIPASGRLLLAIAQRLANDRGMVHAMMDTDSIALVRPDGVGREEFQRRALEVASWFEAISPYAKNKKLLEIEKVNYWGGKLEPLYLIGISAKRYAVYNRLDDGSFRIRKFSSHGLGGFYAPYKDSPYTNIPDPHMAVHKLGGKRWCYDIWYQFIEAMERDEVVGKFGVYRGIQSQLPLKRAAYHQATLSTWKIYKQFSSIPDVRPFGFFSVLPSKAGGSGTIRRAMSEDGSNDLEASQQARLQYVTSIKKPFYAPYADTPEKLTGTIRSMDTGELIPDWYSPVYIGEAIYDYFSHQEFKAVNGNQRGIMKPHDVLIGSIVYVGKEINAVSLMIAEETGGLMGDLLQVTEYGEAQNWGDILKPFHIADLALLTGLSGRAINKLKAGKSLPTPNTVKLLKDAMSRLEKKPLKWREVENTSLAVKLGVSSDIVKDMKYGKYKFNEERKTLLLEME